MKSKNYFSTFSMFFEKSTEKRLRNLESSLTAQSQISFFLYLPLEKNKNSLESENAELASDLQRVSSMKADAEKKNKSLDNQVNELTMIRAGNFHFTISLLLSL